MAYLKINNKDFSHYVKGLTITKTANYNAQINAAGNTVVDYINSKRTIDVVFIPLDGEAMAELLTEIDRFSVSIDYRNPKTNALTTGVQCIIPEDSIDYYTIQSNKVLYNELTLQFVEL